MAIEKLPTLDASGNHAGIVTILLENPGKPVVVLNLELIQRLEATLKALPSSARGVVLSSASGRVFVAGADLHSIQAMNDRELHAYLEYGARVFGMIASLPYPTAAAIGGAALGGGLELAMHCDGLIGAPSRVGKPYPIGLPEAGLSICPGWGGTNLLPARIDPAAAIRMTAEGRPMMYDDAVNAGMFDAVAEDADNLRDVALDWVAGQREPGRTGRDGEPSRWIGRSTFAAPTLTALDAVWSGLPQTGAASVVAEAVDVGLAKGWAAAIQTERDRLVHLRGTPAGKAAIEAFFAKSAKK